MFHVSLILDTLYVSSERKMEICKYCQEKDAIKYSHIIPSFVYKWIKETAATGYMRNNHEPNLRQQDGPKAPLLCVDCEKLFSEVENSFKKDYFTKVANYQNRCPEIVNITPEIIICIYTIAWRVLANEYYFPIENDYTEEEIARFPSLLENMKQSIDRSDFSTYKTHIVPCTKDVLTRLKLPQIDWHFYERSAAAESRIWNNWERFIVFIKIPFSIIVFEIVPNNSDPWIGTQLEGNDCIALSKIGVVPSYVGALVNHVNDQFNATKNEVSEVQHKKILDDFRNAHPNSGSFKTRQKTW